MNFCTTGPMFVCVCVCVVCVVCVVCCVLCVCVMCVLCVCCVCVFVCECCVCVVCVFVCCVIMCVCLCVVCVLCVFVYLRVLCVCCMCVVCVLYVCCVCVVCMLCVLYVYLCVCCVCVCVVCVYLCMCVPCCQLCFTGLVACRSHWSTKPWCVAGIKYYLSINVIITNIFIIYSMFITINYVRCMLIILSTCACYFITVERWLHKDSLFYTIPGWSVAWRSSWPINMITLPAFISMNLLGLIPHQPLISRCCITSYTLWVWCNLAVCCLWMAVDNQICSYLLKVIF